MTKDKIHNITIEILKEYNSQNKSDLDPYPELTDLADNYLKVYNYLLEKYDLEFSAKPGKKPKGL